MLKRFFFFNFEVILITASNSFYIYMSRLLGDDPILNYMRPNLIKTAKHIVPELFFSCVVCYITFNLCPQS